MEAADFSETFATTYKLDAALRDLPATLHRPPANKVINKENKQMVS
jgi:hypothetical protein